MDLVSMQPCDSYDEPVLRRQVEALLRPLGGMQRVVRPGQRVLLKPNMLAARPPEAAVTTHPALVRVVAALVRESGGTVLVGDSPGIGRFEQVARITGIAGATEAAGGELVPFAATRRISTTGRFRQLELAAVYLDADLVINLPKLKTHEMMTLTCGVKNLFGAVVGPAKAGLHLTAGRSRDLFAGLLLEIAFARTVDLTIVDGIVAMEGNGPNSGTPRRLGMLLAGVNPVAVDTIASRLAGIPPHLLPVEQEARQRGLSGSDPGQIETAGDPPPLTVAPFTLPDGLDLQFGLPGFLKTVLRDRLTPLPAADPERCVRCGVCRDVCPPGAITLTKNALKVDSGRCIRCWCCRELCPHRAMTLNKGVLLRLAEKWG